MRELISLFENDIKDFTKEERLIYGVLIPLGLFAILLLANLVESL